MDEGSAAPAGEGLSLLLRCLTISDPALLAPLAEACARAAAGGGVPFEVTAGTPFAHYGARVVFRPTGDPRALAEALGLADHPWGIPTWIGVRVRPGGASQAKGYHPPERLEGVSLPPGLPEGLRPVLAARHRNATELYLRLGKSCPWSSFVPAVLSLLGEEAGAPRGRTRFSPYPRPADDGFCLSLRWQDGDLAALSLYADHRSLPGDDDEVRRAWGEDMDEAERRVYETALAGVRSLGRLPRAIRRHGMLAWTLERGGVWHRAASLLVPPP